MNSGRLMSLLRESFVPVVIVILALFLMLLYVQFRAEYDAGKVTVINIQPIAPSVLEDIDAVVALGETEPIASGELGSEQQRAAELMVQSKWQEAEEIYLGILSLHRSSMALNDLGILYLKKGDVPRALDYFNQAAQTDPSDTSALFNRSLALSRSGHPQQAIGSYRKLLSVHPAHFEGQYNLAILLIKQDDKKAGAAELEKAITLAGGKRKARALYSLGLARRDLNQPDKARDAFNAAIRLRPSDLEARVALAALEPDNPEGQARALAQYETILTLSPDYSPALVNKASILKAQHKWHEAEQSLRDAIQFDPEYVRAHTILGLVLLSQQRWQAARSEFEWLLQRDPTRADAYFNLGRVAYSEKDYDKAVSEYQLALKTAVGNYPEAQLNLGLAYSAMKDYPSAQAAYNTALKNKHQYPEAWYNLGIVHMRMKAYDKAESAFKSALALRPDYEQAWFNLGVLFGKTQQDDLAMDAYRKALAIHPDYHHAQLNLAVRYARRDEFPEAIKLYRKILDRDDTYSIAWFNLGSAYLKNNQPALAVESFRKAVELEPSNTKTLRFLGRALLKTNNEGEAVNVLEKAVAATPADAPLRLELARTLRQAGNKDAAIKEWKKARKLNARLNGLKDEARLLGLP